MRDLVLLLGTGALAYFGFALFALSQKQHRTWAGLPDRIAAFRCAGAALLAASVVPAVMRDGVAFGVLVWIGTLTLSACAVVGTLTVLGKRTA